MSVVVYRIVVPCERMDLVPSPYSYPGHGSFPVFAQVLDPKGYVVVGIVLRAVSEPGEGTTGCTKCHTVLLRRVS